MRSAYFHLGTPGSAGPGIQILRASAYPSGKQGEGCSRRKRQHVKGLDRRRPDTGSRSRTGRCHAKIQMLRLS